MKIKVTYSASGDLMRAYSATTTIDGVEFQGSSGLSYEHAKEVMIKRIKNHLIEVPPPEEVDTDDY